ncbi:MAG: 4Fe-4S binding protein [bacterium]|nr:4Fe-4S binding protein [bacterium]
MTLCFLAIAFLMRKSFCSWLCPVGTISEGLALLGKKIFGRTFCCEVVGLLSDESQVYFAGTVCVGIFLMGSSELRGLWGVLTISWLM